MVEGVGRRNPVVGDGLMAGSSVGDGVVAAGSQWWQQNPSGGCFWIPRALRLLHMPPLLRIWAMMVAALQPGLVAALLLLLEFNTQSSLEKVANHPAGSAAV